ALVSGLVEAELPLEFSDEFGIQALRATISPGRAFAGRRAAHLGASGTRDPFHGGRTTFAGHLRQDLLDRSTGHELKDQEIQEHDAEKRRHHQEEAADDISRHGSEAASLIRGESRGATRSDRQASCTCTAPLTATPILPFRAPS